MRLDVDKHGRRGPTRAEAHNGVEIFCYTSGAQDVSGDFVDWNWPSKDRCRIVVGDVSGHGTPAALLSVYISALLRGRAGTEAKPRGLADLAAAANEELHGLGLPGFFAALLLADLRPSDRSVTMLDACLATAYLWKAAEARIARVQLPRSPALGLFGASEIRAAHGFKTARIHLEDKDMLVLCTDGISESQRLGLPGGELEIFGENLVPAVLRAACAGGRIDVPAQGGSPPCVLDFSEGSPSPRQAALALAAAETCYRLSQPGAPVVAASSCRPESELDAFLQAHLADYTTCLSSSVGDGRAGGRRSTRRVLAPQYDDISVLAVRFTTQS